MRRSAHGASSPDAKLRGISDEQLLDLLDAARRRLGRGDARRQATGDTLAYASAVVALEVEASRRGLRPPSPHERATRVQVLRRLSHLSPTLDGAEWERLLGELDLRGLWAVFRWAHDALGPEIREDALVHLCLALDRLAYGERAELLRIKMVDMPSRLWMRLGRLGQHLEETFGILIDRQIEEDWRG